MEYYYVRCSFNSFEESGKVYVKFEFLAARYCFYFNREKRIVILIGYISYGVYETTNHYCNSSKR